MGKAEINEGVLRFKPKEKVFYTSSTQLRYSYFLLHQLILLNGREKYCPFSKGKF